MVDTPGFVTLSEAGAIGTVVDTGGVQYTVHVQRAQPILASPAPETSRVFRNEAASVYSVTVAEVSADCLLLLLDAATIPADGVVAPVAWARVTAPGIAEIQFGAVPASFLTGLVAVLSSGATPFLKVSGPTGCFYAKVN